MSPDKVWFINLDLSLLCLQQVGVRFQSSASIPTTKLFINGQFVESKTKSWVDLHNPATNEVKMSLKNLNGRKFWRIVQVITRVPNATADEMQSAVDAAKEAYKSWSKTSILTRQQVMFKYQDIIRKNMVGLSWFDKKQTIILFSQRELAESVTLEQGKTLADAEGDVLRGLRKFLFIKIYVKSIRSVVN